MKPKDPTVAAFLSDQEQLQILTHLAAFYPAATGIPASFGEEINMVFSKTLAILKERGLIAYETNGVTALPSAIAITDSGMAFLGREGYEAVEPDVGPLDNPT